MSPFMAQMRSVATSAFQSLSKEARTVTIVCSTETKSAFIETSSPSSAWTAIRIGDTAPAKKNNRRKMHELKLARSFPLVSRSDKADKNVTARHHRRYLGVRRQWRRVARQLPALDSGSHLHSAQQHLCSVCVRWLANCRPYLQVRHGMVRKTLSNR